MKVLIIGSGGREHALTLAYCKSDRVTKVYVAPGNGLIDYHNPKAENCPDVKSLDLKGIIALAKEKKIDLIDVAQDDPLAAGFVDTLTKEKIPTFGPTKAAAEIEWNKSWARKFMRKYHLPIPEYASFTSSTKAKSYVSSLPEQILFIKASGLAAGKGVIRTEGHTQAHAAIDEINRFGAAGETFLIEHALFGEEFSLFVICDGENYVITKSAQDHKTIYNADTGPNTGGMGCVSPTNALNQKMIKEVEDTIIKPFLTGMQKEGRPYTGILYIGGMVTENGVKIVEFNARWGDPEAEVILPSIQTDYVSIVESVLAKKLKRTAVKFDYKIHFSIAGCSRGYPGDYALVKGKEVFGIPEVLKQKNITLIGAGIKRSNNRFFADGGRIFHVVAEGKDIHQARKFAYEAISQLYLAGNNLYYRTDIGWREMERFHLEHLT
jgi:phosphoribosylamine---glycine ligase